MAHISLSLARQMQRRFSDDGGEERQQERKAEERRLRDEIRAIERAAIPARLRLAALLSEGAFDREMEQRFSVVREFVEWAEREGRNSSDEVLWRRWNEDRANEMERKLPPEVRRFNRWQRVGYSPPP